MHAQAALSYLSALLNYTVCTDIVLMVKVLLASSIITIASFTFFFKCLLIVMLIELHYITMAFNAQLETALKKTHREAHLKRILTCF